MVEQASMGCRPQCGSWHREGGDFGFMGGSGFCGGRGGFGPSVWGGLWEVLRGGGFGALRGGIQASEWAAGLVGGGRP